jgi:hypothetical protein
MQVKSMSCQYDGAQRIRSKFTVNNIWQSHSPKPHRVKTFQSSRDAKFLEKLADVVASVSDRHLTSGEQRAYGFAQT